jgi:hypothetical protein
VELQWITHQALVQHAPCFSGVGGDGVLEPWASSDFLGKSWESLGRIPSSPQNPGGHLPEILGILHHQTASFAGAPITDDKRYHVTQPRARVNVSCGPQRGRQGVGGTTRRERQRRAKAGEELGGPGCQTKCRERRDSAGEKIIGGDEFSREFSAFTHKVWAQNSVNVSF